MRTYHLSDPIGPGLTFKVHNDKDCIFCRYCQCIWDYSNGPYMKLSPKPRKTVEDILDQIREKLDELEFKEG